MKLSHVLMIVVLSGTLLGGCEKEPECFEVDLREFRQKYGDGVDNVYKFCEDRGFDRPYRWSKWNKDDISGPIEICCEDGGVFSF